jgi:hypothetical protein
MSERERLAKLLRAFYVPDKSMFHRAAYMLEEADKEIEKLRFRNDALIAIIKQMAKKDETEPSA